MAEARSTVIPNYLTAATPEKLQRLMLETNMRLGAWHNYQIQFVNGKWFAWYHEDISRFPNMKALAKDPREMKGEK